jgi:hypothetical protein
MIGEYQGVITVLLAYMADGMVRVRKAVYLKSAIAIDSSIKQEAITETDFNNVRQVAPFKNNFDEHVRLLIPNRGFSCRYRRHRLSLFLGEGRTTKVCLYGK